MIGFISSYVIHSLLITFQYRPYKAISHLHTSTVHCCARTRIPSLHLSSPSNRSQHTNYNSLTGLRTPNITHKIFSPKKHSSHLTHRTNLNCGILTAANILSHSTDNCSHEVFNSLVQVFFNYESPAAVSHRELTENKLSLSYKPLIRHAENHSASTVASLRCGCVTSLLTRRSRDPSLLLRDPNVYSCRLATSEERRGSARHRENTTSSTVE
jgi:hypothetical protein